MPRTKEQKAKKAIYNKQLYQLNKDKIKQQQREYRQTDSGKKSRRISRWKSSGIILRDDQTWDSIYRTYIDCTNCEQCDKVFQTTLDRHMDHCHTTGYIRNIVCRSCNVLRGVEDAKKIIWVIDTEQD